MIANQTAEGRIVSVLEGGYKVHLGHISPLAQSVASHVRALINTHSGNFLTENRSLDQFKQEQKF